LFISFYLFNCVLASFPVFGRLTQADWVAALLYQDDPKADRVVQDAFGASGTIPSAFVHSGLSFALQCYCDVSRLNLKPYLNIFRSKK
jgi:hypothetical protein